MQISYNGKHIFSDFNALDEGINMIGIVIFCSVKHYLAEFNNDNMLTPIKPIQ